MKDKDTIEAVSIAIVKGEHIDCIESSLIRDKYLFSRIADDTIIVYNISRTNAYLKATSTDNNLLTWNKLQTGNKAHTILANRCVDDGLPSEYVTKCRSALFENLKNNRLYT